MIGRLALLVLMALALVGTAQAQVTLSVSSTPITGIPITVNPADNNGNTDGNTNFTRTYPLRTPVSLTAPATFNGEVFSNWTVNGISQGPGANAITVVMLNNENAVAIYTTPNVQLTITSQNPDSGVPITAAPADVLGSTGGTTTVTLTYANLTTVTLTAPPGAAGNVFDHWIIGGVAQPSGQSTISFTLMGPARVSAVYVVPVQLIVQSQNPASGVAVTAAPPDAGNLSGGTTAFTLNYAPGAIVTLTAPKSQGLNNFANWSVNGVAQPAGQNAIRVTMPVTAASVTAVAVYVTPIFTITASATGTHGTVAPTGSVTVAAGGSQTFTASPASGWMVNVWTLDGATAQTGGNTFAVSNVTANHTLAVSFRVVIVFHPADTNKDGRMSIAEVTAYGHAWKLGLAWPNAPSPIPQTFVTNAIMLWKSGELYSNDPSKAAPDTWVPLASAPQLAKPAVTTVSAGTSVAAVTQEPDGTWLVNITVTPPTAARGYTLEEQLPRGATLSWISSGGAADAHGALRWGPFTDSSARILSYRIKVSGTVSVSGAASFDGAVVKTTGTRSIGGNQK